MRITRKLNNYAFAIFLVVARMFLDQKEYDRRCNRFCVGFGFRFLGFDWFKHLGE